MTSDRDIEEYVTNHYNPHIQTPEEYMNSTNWGSGERQRVAFNRAQDMYDLIPQEEKEESEQQPEEPEIQEEGEQPQEEEQPEDEEDAFQRIFNVARQFLKGVFGRGG